MGRRLRYLVHFLILFTAFAVQSSPLISKISITGVVPDLMFVILFVYALYLKQTEVLTLAIILGTFKDLLFENIYGVNTLLMIGIVCLFYLLNRYIYCESYLTVAAYVFVTAFIFEALHAAVDMAIWKTTAISVPIFKKIIVRCFYNGLIVMPVFAIGRRAHLKRQEVR